MKLPLEGTSLEARQQSLTEPQRDGGPLAVVGILNTAPYKFFAHYKYLLFLLRQKQILCADENENNGENYSQCFVLKAVEQEKTERNADETVADVGQCRLFINQIVLYVKYNCQYCGGNKKYKVNSLRNRLRHILIKREVENKDSASAEAHCAENSGDCSGDNIKYHFISILIPA